MEVVARCVSFNCQMEGGRGVEGGGTGPCSPMARFRTVQGQSGISGTWLVLVDF